MNNFLGTDNRLATQFDIVLVKIVKPFYFGGLQF